MYVARCMCETRRQESNHKKLPPDGVYLQVCQLFGVGVIESMTQVDFFNTECSYTGPVRH